MSKIDVEPIDIILARYEAGIEVDRAVPPKPALAPVDGVEATFVSQIDAADATVGVDQGAPASGAGEDEMLPAVAGA